MLASDSFSYCIQSCFSFRSVLLKFNATHYTPERHTSIRFLAVSIVVSMKHCKFNEVLSLDIFYTWLLFYPVQSWWDIQVISPRLFSGQNTILFHFSHSTLTTLLERIINWMFISTSCLRTGSDISSKHNITTIVWCTAWGTIACVRKKGVRLPRNISNLKWDLQISLTWEWASKTTESHFFIDIFNFPGFEWINFISRITYSFFLKLW